MISKLVEYIKESKSIVFFGGAGVSTESGIPDFRSKDGLYNQHDIRFDDYEPEYLLSKDCLDNKPEVFYEFYRQKMDVRNIKPNITHKVLAKLEDIGKLTSVVTQNIDGLHQKAGSKNVHEIHGSTLRNYCPSCGKTYPSDYIFESEEDIPVCECGNDIIRPDVTLYQEQLPETVFKNAIKDIANADMLIVGGTSLKVYPAAGIIRYFKGKHMIVINNEELSMQMGDGDLFIKDSLGNVFKAIDNAIANNFE